METFKEKQRFNQIWLWLLFATIFIVEVIITFAGNNNQNSSINGYLGLFLLVPVVILILIINMQTEINEQEISVRYFPLINSWKKYAWDDIEHAEIRKYKPIAEYGGWGIKGYSKNKAYNVSGNIGLQLTFKDGKKLLIGTRKPDLLKNYLAYIKYKYSVQCIRVN